MGVAVIFLGAASVVQNVSEFSKNIELKLMNGGVAHAHWRRPAITLQPWHFPLHKVAFAGNAIDHLELIRAARYAAHQPVSPAASFVVVAGMHEGEERESCVPQPAIAVTPIPFAPGLFRQ